MRNLFYQIRFYLYLIFTNRFKKEITNPIEKDGWELIFNDEFNSDILDTDKWTTHQYWGNIQNGTMWVPEQISFKDGECLLTSDNYNGPNPVKDHTGTPQHINTISGTITTNPSLYKMYGYYEIRCKVPQGGIKYWPAFWFSTKESWPPEIDQFEYMGAGNSGRMTMTYHWLDDKPNWDEMWGLIEECHIKGYLPIILSTINDNIKYMQNPNEPPPWSADKQIYIDKLISLRIHKMHVSGLNGMDFSEHYHTYGMKWEKNRITWYFDNLVVKTLKEGQWVNFGKIIKLPEYPMYTIIGNGAEPGYIFKEGEHPMSVYVSYFRSYDEK